MNMKTADKYLRIAAIITGELLACGTIAALCRAGDSERLLLAAGTLFLVLVPEMIERLFHCRISTAVYLTGILYALGPMMGHCWKFYYTIPYWDKLLHLCGGVMFVFLGVYLFELLSRGGANHTSAVVFALCFSLAVSVVWEFVEYGADRFLGMDMQSDTVVSGITSYLLGAKTGVTGSIESIRSVAVNGTLMPVNGYLDIGLHDTMLDMLLESFGAFLTCVLLFLDRGRHPLIQPRPRGSAEPAQENSAVTGRNKD